MDPRAPSLANTRLDRYFHICALFDSRDEEYEVLSPFYAEAVAWGEKNLHIVAPGGKDEHLRRLAAHGVDAKACVACGSLEVLGWDEAYLLDGVFDQDRMLAMVDEVFDAARSAGYPRLRIMGNMGWAFRGDTRPEDVIDYEARVNEVLGRARQPAICVYDIAWLSGTMMMDILRCHPLTLVGGILQENPFYIPPEALLPQLKARRVPAEA